MYKQQGVTLIELMVTLSIVAILMAAGTPIMRELTINRLADRLSQELILDITFARNQAITQQQPVTIEAINNDWNIGWRLIQNGFVIREKGDVFQPMSTNNALSSTFHNAQPLVFDASGRATNATGNAQLGSFTVNVPQCTGNRVRTISINFIGQITSTEAPC